MTKQLIAPEITIYKDGIIAKIPNKRMAIFEEQDRLIISFKKLYEGDYPTCHYWHKDKRITYTTLPLTKESAQVLMATLAVYFGYDLIEKK